MGFLEKARTIFHQSLVTSSMKGLSRSARSPSAGFRIMWAFATTIGLTLGIWYLFKTFSAYFSYQTVMSYRQGYHDVPLPDITVCNLQPFGENSSHKLDNYFDSMDNFAIPDDIISEFAFEEITDFIKEEVQTLSGFYQNTDISTFVSLGHKTDTFIAKCQWRSGNRERLVITTECGMQEAHLLTSPEFGNCFKLRNNGTINRKIFGLNLILYLDDPEEAIFDSYDETRQESMGEGVIVVIHEPQTLPDFSQGITVAPGHSATIRITPVKTDRLPSPYGACIQTPDEEFTWLGHNFSYTLKACDRVCAQRHLIEKCECHDVTLPNTKENRVMAPPCGQIPNITDTASIVRFACYVNESVSSNLSCPECGTPCDTIRYPYTINQIQWPPVALHDAFAEMILETSNLSIDDIEDFSTDRENFVEVNVELILQEVTHLQEKPALPFENLLGGIGGIMNLWMGVTFITLFEVIELLVKLLCQVKEGDNKVQSVKG